MRTPRVFCAAEQSIDWEEPPVENVNIMDSTFSQDGIGNVYYVDGIRDVLVVRDFIRLSLFNQGLKLGKRKGFRGFEDHWRLVLRSIGIWVRMSACAFF